MSNVIVDAKTHIKRGLAYYVQGRYDRAIAEFDEAISLDANNAAAFFNRGNAFGRKGEYESAVIDYQDSIRLDPHYAAAFESRGDAYLHQGDFDSGIADYGEAIRLDSKSCGSFKKRAEALIRKNAESWLLEKVFPESDKGYDYATNIADRKRAISDYDEAIMLDPTDSDSFSARGWLHFMDGLYDQAIADYDEAIRLSPKNALAFRNRGIAYDEKGELDHAIADIDKALVLDPDSDRASGLRDLKDELSGRESPQRDFEMLLATLNTYGEHVAPARINAIVPGNNGDAAAHKIGSIVCPESSPDVQVAGARSNPAEHQTSVGLRSVRTLNQQVNELLLRAYVGVPDTGLVGRLGKFLPRETIIRQARLIRQKASTVGGATVVLWLLWTFVGPTLNASVSIPLQPAGGTYVVPTLINDTITLNFTVDSGATDVSIPADVVLTLIRAGALDKSDFIGSADYVLADGSTISSVRFRIRSLKVGNLTVEDVIGSIASARGSLLLGQSFLSRFKSWSVDNSRQALVLTE